MGSTENPIRGRGSPSRIEGRFARTTRESAADTEALIEDGQRRGPDTQLMVENARSIVSRNQSPDVPFAQSINPYRGCEHGCIYCYARPSHAYMDLSPGIDFETRIFWKPDAADLLRAELAKPGYTCDTMALGSNTDCYQPAERELQVTRRILEVLAECRHPVAIVTKSALVERDIDILAPMAAAGLARVMISVTTLDDELKRRMEPRTAGPSRRLETIRRLSEAGIPVGVLAAPVIPALNDHELESILSAGARAGAKSAGYILLRLPHEVAPLFSEWLEQHYPLRRSHVLNQISRMRNGALSDPRFGSRMRGSGPLASLLRQRFERACREHGLNRAETPLVRDGFRPPRASGPQLGLF
ncbi:MAG: PA0069 family radical SAM protein [Gammaproteobacteria bacterium]|nr:PA0069 family radical SAM protein [Gammaproteobacteria bacterium]